MKNISKLLIINNLICITVLILLMAYPLNSNASVFCNTNSDCGTNVAVGSPFCQDNDVYQSYKIYACNFPGTSYSNCSNSVTSKIQQGCGPGQTCLNASCTSLNNCTYHSYQRCIGNSIYWFDSCGIQQDLFQNCSYNQTCQNNSCIGQNQTSLLVTKTLRNLSSGNLTWSNFVNANPSDIVQFSIIISSSNNQYVNNVTVRDVFPANLLYKNSLTLDGLTNLGDITSGINIGNISAGQTRNITYQAQVAQAQNFSSSTTTLNNSVTVASTDSGYNSKTAIASVIVIKTGVSDATTVATGLTNNFFIDSFFLPLMISLIGIWLFRSDFLGITDWLDSKKLKHKNRIAQKQLKNKIIQIKKKEKAF